jgi:hypothetical protein
VQLLRAELIALVEAYTEAFPAECAASTSMLMHVGSGSRSMGTDENEVRLHHLLSLIDALAMGDVDRP